MAITAFTGPPGSGKSHALVKDIILPAVMAGRRVLSNVDGLSPDAIRAYCLERVSDASKLGQVELFHGDDARKPGFWPDEEHPDTQSTVKGGDLVVFDEWALYFPRRGNWPEGCNVEAFLRWHRHLNGPDGTATDVAIGTQLATDVHQNVRGLIVKSYKFRKLTALGAQGQYTWQLYEGHLQPKGGYYRTGTGTYDRAIFPLYASSAAAKEGTHVELRTNKRESIFSGWQAWAVVGGAPLLLIGGGWALYSTFNGGSAQAGVSAVHGPEAVAGAVPGQYRQPARPAVSPWRIVGQIDGEFGMRVLIANEEGAMRMMKPDGFSFDQDRAVSGMVDGKMAFAEERLPSANQGSMLDGMMR